MNDNLEFYLNKYVFSKNQCFLRKSAFFVNLDLSMYPTHHTRHTRPHREHTVIRTALSATPAMLWNIGRPSTPKALGDGAGHRNPGV